MNREDASALADLQMHWDEAYIIGVDGDIWSARFRDSADSADELKAQDSVELRELIRADYARRQQSRTVSERGGGAARGFDQGNFAGLRGERMST